jgi:hypothetical protein
VFRIRVGARKCANQNSDSDSSGPITLWTTHGGQLELQHKVVELPQLDFAVFGSRQSVAPHFDSEWDGAPNPATPFGELDPDPIEPHDGARDGYDFDAWGRVITAAIHVQRAAAEPGIVSEVDRLEPGVGDVEIEIGLLAEYQSDLEISVIP